MAAYWWDPDDESLSIWTAWRPYGADSLAHSYMDLSGNGNDATVGTAPGWDTGEGWQFTAASSQYLTTAFTPANDQSQTVIVQFKAVTNNGYLFGCIEDANEEFWIIPDDGGGNVEFANGQSNTDATVVLAGNLAVAGDEGFKEGVAQSMSLGAWAGASAEVAYIGAYNQGGGGGAAGFLGGTIQAMAIYDVTLTDAQVAKVAVAMTAMIQPAILISVWNGMSWASLDLEVNDTINALAIGAPDAMIPSGYQIYAGIDAAGNAQVAGSTTITYAGTGKAYPVMVISRSGAGTATITSLRNETTGESVSFNYELMDGEELEIDMKQRLLTSTFAGNVMAQMLAGDLFGLQPGSNQITLLVRIRDKPVVTSYLVWRDTYLSAD